VHKVARILHKNAHAVNDRSGAFGKVWSTYLCGGFCYPWHRWIGYMGSKLHRGHSQDIFKVATADLPKTESVLTLVGGKIVYDANILSTQ